MAVFQITENSAEDLISSCAQPPNGSILHCASYGNQVVKIADRAVIKFGFGVTKEEANNQTKAYEPIDPIVVRVPRVHRFFSNTHGSGYIVMDYISGVLIDPLEDPARIEVVGLVLAYFATIRGPKPGDLCGGPS